MGFIDELSKKAKTSDDITAAAHEKERRAMAELKTMSIWQIKSKIENEVKKNVYDGPAGTREVTIEYELYSVWSTTPFRG